MAVTHAHELQTQAINSSPGPQPHSADRVTWFRYHTNSPADIVGVQISRGHSGPFAATLTVDGADGVNNFRIQPSAHADFEADKDSSIAIHFAKWSTRRTVAEIVRVLQPAWQPPLF